MIDERTVLFVEDGQADGLRKYVEHLFRRQRLELACVDARLSREFADRPLPFGVIRTRARHVFELADRRRQGSTLRDGQVGLEDLRFQARAALDQLRYRGHAGRTTDENDLVEFESGILLFDGGEQPIKAHLGALQ